MSLRWHRVGRQSEAASAVEKNRRGQDQARQGARGCGLAPPRVLVCDLKLPPSAAAL